MIRISRSFSSVENISDHSVVEIQAKVVKTLCKFIEILISMLFEHFELQLQVNTVPLG
jgi:hypothetical protein